MALAPLSMSPKEAVLESVLPSLYLSTAQVKVTDLNPHEDRQLQQNSNYRWLDKNGYSDKASRLLDCGTKFAHFRDKNGHDKLSKTFCKYEFCPICGMKGSRTHRTRNTRAHPRLMWAPVLGYMVFTLPLDLSRSRMPREILNRLEKESYDIVQRNFKTEGAMARIHLAGDRPGHLRIHVNILFPITGTNGIGRVDPLILASVQQAWTVFINKFFCLSLDVTDVKYSFATTMKKKYAKIKYVLRPIIDAFMFMTLSDEDKHYIVGLAGWHNTRWFGKLANHKYKAFLLSKGLDPLAYEKKDPYLSNVCPVCGAKFKHVGTVWRRDINKDAWRWIDDHTLMDRLSYIKLQEMKAQK